VLLVDDEPAFQRVGGAWLRGLGHDVVLAYDASSALAQFADSSPDIVLLDLVMPPSLTPEAGLALIPQFAPVPVIVLTGHADHEYALRAAEAGAWDFLAKPVDPDMLRFVAGRAIRQRRLEQELRALKAVQDAGDLGIIGNAPAILRLRDMVRRLAPTNVSVVILGPTGTGKELVARALHRCSRRAGGPFVPVHCGALAAELLESELFGHVRGAFTGALHEGRLGRFELAHGGILCLDEIGELPLDMQPVLLRVLEEGVVYRVGDTQGRPVDIRLIAMTNRNLRCEVAAGRFRADLFYRLSVTSIEIPPLRDRAGDAALLIAHFNNTLSQKHDIPPLRFASEALQALEAYAWPGNIRELRNVVEGLLLTGAHDITPDDLPAEISASKPAPPSLRLEDTARAAMLQAINSCDGNLSEAARQLGISRSTLHRRMRELRAANDVK
jgi:two-component system NtrC family response regulator